MVYFCPIVVVEIASVLMAPVAINTQWSVYDIHVHREVYN